MCGEECGVDVSVCVCAFCSCVFMCMCLRIVTYIQPVGTSDGVCACVHCTPHYR